jgi:hypothetical protein
VELVVVIVLDDREAGLSREPQQLEPPGRGQRDGGGELMMWRDVHRADRPSRGKAPERAQVEPASVDLHWHDLGAGQSKSLPGGPIPRVLDGDH